uniref:Uncharacterized protein n=1 Tax=Rousettus bat poxvirus TaxID=3141933 RepID=A0AAU7E2I5_9POXV
MLPVQPLRDQLSKLLRSRGCRGGSSGALLRRAFCRVPFTAAHALIVAGLHPDCVTQRWSDGIIGAIAEKSYLLPPKCLSFRDLLLAVEKFSNAARFYKHILFYQRRLVCEASSAILSTCVPHMTLFDEDVRCILERFPQEAANIMARANVVSMFTMSFIFEEDIAEEMLLLNPGIREALYEHQCFSNAFLQRMFFNHGIAPTNGGINDDITPSLAVDILAGIQCARAAASFLYTLDRRVAASTAMRNFVLVSIMNGTNLAHYQWYARTYLRDRKPAMHVYARIFFRDAEVTLRGHTMTRERLKNICEFIQCYVDELDFVVSTLLELEHYDLLALVLPRVPASALTEDIVLRAIRDASVPIPVSSLRVRSECVIRQCIARGAEDAIDFLDVVSAPVLASFGADLFTSYAFSTEWFNRDATLLRMFVARYGYCGAMMRRLLFEYHLSVEAAMAVLDFMVDNAGMAAFSPTQMCELGYLLCTTGTFRVRSTRRTVTLMYADRRDDAECLLFASEFCYPMSMALQACGVTQLKTCAATDISLVRHAQGVCLQFTRAQSTWPSAGAWLCAQLYDVCVLAKHGLFHAPLEFLPEWTPVLDAFKGEMPMPPQCFHESLITPLDFSQLMRYEDLGSFLTNAMRLEDAVSNFHAAINVLMSTLMVYLVIGSMMLESDDQVCDYIHGIINAFVRGLKINGILSGSSPETREELARLRAVPCARAGSVLVQSPDALSHTLRLCADLCVAAILDNN